MAVPVVMGDLLLLITVTLGNTENTVKTKVELGRKNVSAVIVGVGITKIMPSVLSVSPGGGIVRVMFVALF